jgi:hypothetical protein
MKPEDAERELVQDGFQHRNHVLFGDGFHTSDVLPLRHRFGAWEKWPTSTYRK